VYKLPSDYTNTTAGKKAHSRTYVGQNLKNEVQYNFNLSLWEFLFAKKALLLSDVTWIED